MVTDLKNRFADFVTQQKSQSDIDLIRNAVSNVEGQLHGNKKSGAEFSKKIFES